MTGGTDERIEIALGIDADFALHAAVLMASVLRHTERPIRFHLLHDGVAHEVRSLVEAAALQAVCQWYEIALDDPQGATSHGWSLAASYRLLIPELMPFAKVLYLDSDMVFLDDVAKVWDTPLDGAGVAAVRDLPGSEADAKAREPISRDYFNSGLLLMDLDYWRREEVARKAWAAMAVNTFRFPDQDALNTVFKGAWNRLPDRWNVQRAMIKASARQLGMKPGEYVDFILHPGNMHYTGSPKPWAGKQRHPFNWAYWQVARELPVYKAIAAASKGGARKVASRNLAYWRHLARIPVRALT